VKRVFMIECSGPVWRSVLNQCREQAGWDPVLWTAAAADEPAIAALCPQALFIAGPDATLGLAERQAPWPLPPLEPALLAALAPAESIALHMMDRMDPWGGSGFTHDHRRRHYHRLLRYWMGALDALRPDLIVFSIAPHVVFDYILFVLARHRGIQTIMYERIGLPGWVFPIADFESGSETLRTHLARHPSVSTEELPDAFRTWFTESTSGAAAVPANFRKKLERYHLEERSQMPPLWRSVFYEFKRAFILWRKYGVEPMRNSYLRSAHYPHERARWSETLRARLHGMMRKRRMMRMYDSLCRSPAEEEPYVFLALHYQPERATVPMGGVFGDQTLIVDTLAATLPPGWKLYIKEHPWQLQSFGWGEMQRTEAFYAAIARHPNVVLLPRSADTSSMVRGSRAVATVTGSVGWEALCSGVPVLLFGAAWYRDCHGVLPVTSCAALESAFGKLRNGWPVEKERVAAFCAALAQSCVRGVLEPELEQTGNLDYDEAARSMSAALVAAVNRAGTNAG
jgi:hypothetical protein